VAIEFVSQPGLLSGDQGYPRALKRFLVERRQDPDLTGVLKVAFEGIEEHWPDPDK
jgi:hypothetical protein